MLVGIAVLVAVVLKAFFVQAFYVPSGSMEDTLVRSDRILVEKVSGWGQGEIARGDIVVFADPGGWLETSDSQDGDGPLVRLLTATGLYPAGGHLVKRVIGVEGDTVRCCDEQGRMAVNGQSLREDYLAPGDEPSLTRFRVHVPQGHLWVQGDHRSNSLDSRYHQSDPGGGMVPSRLVVGKVFATVWPLQHATVFERPAGFEALP